MATGDLEDGGAYPFGTTLCFLSYTGAHRPKMYLGYLAYSYIRDGVVKFAQGAAPVDVIVDLSEWDSYHGVGWDERETILTRYHLWDPATCPKPSDESA
jgi:hypothetical protein